MNESNQKALTAMSDTVLLSTATVAALADDILSGDRVALARAITLVESAAPQHRDRAQDLLAKVLPHTGESIRIGVTGAPGAGKSAFIDSFGRHLTERGHKVAVLAIDPSSARTGGSILGDKTRMERLSRDDRAFIRPSPAGGILGGAAGKTREAILLCEAAGYDIIIIETVGAGQNEISLRSLVDFLLLLLIAGAGDELQGMKKGVIEIADALVVNKADGDNLAAANATRAQFERALQFVAPATPGWQTHARTASGLTGDGIGEIWTLIGEFTRRTEASGGFERRRSEQRRQWLRDALDQQIRERVYGHEALRAALPAIEAAVMAGEIPAARAAEELLRLVLPR